MTLLPAGILELLQTPIPFYTMVLTVMWLLIQVISKISHIKKVFPWTLNSKYVYGILACYIILTLLIIQLDVNIFPYLHAFILALTLWLLASASSSTKASLTLLTVIVALMPVLVMVSTKHPFPLADDARFPGFAAAIENDGRWVPYKYSENSYYQFFHLIPALEYILASVTGVGVLGVMSYYLTLKFALYLTYLLFVFLVVEKLIKDRPSSLAAALLLSITPPLALTQVVHQCYAIVLFMASAFMITKLHGGQRPLSLSRAASMPAVYLLMMAGIVAHATHTLMLLALLLPLAIIDKSREVRRKTLRIAGFILVISLTYWMYTYVLDAIIRPSINAFNRFIELLTGEATPWLSSRVPWYTSESSTFFISWALVPSITASHILLSTPRLLLKRSQLNVNGPLALGLIGLVGTIINYALRTLPTLGGRYFYWLYLLMLPLSALVVKCVSRKFASLIPAIALIFIVSFYGIQDPTLAANTYGNYIGWADRTSWEHAWNIISIIPQDLKVARDSRIIGPIDFVSMVKNIKITRSPRPDYVIIANDALGIRQYLKEKDVIRLINPLSNIVYSSGFYNIYARNNQ